MSSPRHPPDAVGWHSHAVGWVAAWNRRDLGYMALYRRENGNRVVDVVELDDHGLAARVMAMCNAEQA